MISVRNIVGATLASTVFLSRLPIPTSADSKPLDFTKTAHAFPLAGAVIAIIPAIVLWATTALGLNSMIAATLCVTSMIAVTGALHEDGLADLIDGFWGGHTKECKLEIMRDSAIGTYGVLALILSVSLRVMLLSVLIEAIGASAAALALIAMASLSRFAILQPWYLLPPARTHDADVSGDSKKEVSSLSGRFGRPDKETFIAASVLTFPAIILLIYLCSFQSALIALALFQVCIIALSALCKNHIGGHTGDTLGATQQLSELGLLFGLVLTI